jgi:hypothetical protein
VALTDADFVAPQGAREEAERGLEWRREYGRGGTEVGVARARDIANGRQLSIETIQRMVSYFARHEVDQEGEGWNPDEDGYPSAGRIAWALWGGNPGRRWAERVLDQWRTEQEASERPARSGTGRDIMNVKRINSHATFEVKAATEQSPAGEVEALVSVFGNKDLVGDRVMPGAFAKSLERYAELGKAIPFVWSHQWDNPDAYIGKVVEASETDEGLFVRAELFDTANAKHIKTLLQSGVVSEFSFAYDIIEQAPGKDGVNELRELHILEAGPTLKGANPATQLVGVRSAAVGTDELEPGQDTAHLDEPTEGGTGAKAGRVLSNKNESRIKDAVALLNEVLGSLPADSETSKAEEPAGVKAEVEVETPETPAMDAATAQLLLELETETE